MFFRNKVNKYEVICSVDDGKPFFRIECGEDELQAVLVDGEAIEPEQYLLESDPTIITFSEKYLKDLSDGTHDLDFVFKMGLAEAILSVESTSLCKRCKSGLKIVGAVAAVAAVAAVGVCVCVHINKYKD